MPRFRTYGAIDEPPRVDGDERFIGVNMRFHPAILPPGYVSEAINARFNDGVAEPRKGFVQLAWINHTQLQETVIAIMEEGGVPGAIMGEGGGAILEE